MVHVIQRDRKKKMFGTTLNAVLFPQLPSIWYFVHDLEITLTYIHLDHPIRFRQRRAQSINDPMGEPGLCSRCKGVDAEDRQVACTMMEGGPCSACKEREVIREKIEQLEAEIAKLKAKHHALGNTMNAIHDPFIHKFPPEIGSYIFRLCLPTLHFDNIQLWIEAMTSTRALRLGAVCQKWRQLAWTTPDLWDTIYLTIRPSMKRSLAESLPDLLHEWLSRSGIRPLTFFFRYFESSDESDFVPYHDEYSDESTLESATDLVIEVINLHSGRWRNLHLDVGAADISDRFCGSAQPNQLFGLELQVSDEITPTQKFAMKTKPFPTQLTLVNFSPTSIDIGWDNITHVNASDVSTSECLQLLRLAPALEYCVLDPLDDPTLSFNTTILQLRLRSLSFLYGGRALLEAIKVPFLEKWTQECHGGSLPVITMVSLLERSGCYLKILKLEGVLLSTNFRVLLQAIPSLEHLRIHVLQDWSHDGEIDDILTRIFRSPSSTSAIPLEESTRELFLPRLLSMECIGGNRDFTLFSWDDIPQLYRQGHRRSLTLKSVAYPSHISDETASQLLNLVDEGVDLQILDKATEVGGDFLENFRKRVRGLASLERK